MNLYDFLKSLWGIIAFSFLALSIFHLVCSRRRLEYKGKGWARKISGVPTGTVEAIEHMNKHFQTANRMQAVGFALAAAMALFSWIYLL